MLNFDNFSRTSSTWSDTLWLFTRSFLMSCSNPVAGPCTCVWTSPYLSSRTCCGLTMAPSLSLVLKMSSIFFSYFLIYSLCSLWTGLGIYGTSLRFQPRPPLASLTVYVLFLRSERLLGSPTSSARVTSLPVHAAPFQAGCGLPQLTLIY